MKVTCDGVPIEDQVHSLHVSTASAQCPAFHKHASQIFVLIAVKHDACSLRSPKLVKLRTIFSSCITPCNLRALQQAVCVLRRIQLVELRTVFSSCFTSCTYTSCRCIHSCSSAGVLPLRGSPSTTGSACVHAAPANVSKSYVTLSTSAASMSLPHLTVTEPT